MDKALHPRSVVVLDLGVTIAHRLVKIDHLDRSVFRAASRWSPTGALPYLQQDGHACGGSYMSSGSYCVPKSPQWAPTVYKPANAQCPAGF